MLIKDENFYFDGYDRCVILIHSFTSGTRDVRTLGRWLWKNQYSVYAINLRGHGTSSMDDVLEYNINDWHLDVKNAVNYMKSLGYKKIAIFGLSMGGMISIRLTFDDDSIIAGGVFSSALLPGQTEKIKSNFIERYQKQNNIILSDLEEKVLREKLNITFKDIDAFRAESITRVKENIKPIFIAQGASDEIIDAELAIQFKNLLYKAQVHFHWYENEPHVITVGTAGKRLQVDLLAFLSTLSW